MASNADANSCLPSLARRKTACTSCWSWEKLADMLFSKSLILFNISSLLLEAAWLTLPIEVDNSEKFWWKFSNISSLFVTALCSMLVTVSVRSSKFRLTWLLSFSNHSCIPSVWVCRVRISCSRFPEFCSEKEVSILVSMVRSSCWFPFSKFCRDSIIPFISLWVSSMAEWIWPSFSLIPVNRRSISSILSALTFSISCNTSLISCWVSEMSVCTLSRLVKSWFTPALISCSSICPVSPVLLRISSLASST